MGVFRPFCIILLFLLIAPSNNINWFVRNDSQYKSQIDTYLLHLNMSSNSMLSAQCNHFPQHKNLYVQFPLPLRSLKNFVIMFQC